MTARGDAYKQAYFEGRASPLKFVGYPYAGIDVTLAPLWLRGYKHARINEFYSHPSMQPYLEARRGGRTGIRSDTRTTVEPWLAS